MINRRSLIGNAVNFASVAVVAPSGHRPARSAVRPGLDDAGRRYLLAHRHSLDLQAAFEATDHPTAEEEDSDLAVVNVAHAERRDARSALVRLMRSHRLRSVVVDGLVIVDPGNPNAPAYFAPGRDASDLLTVFPAEMMARGD